MQPRQRERPIEKAKRWQALLLGTHSLRLGQKCLDTEYEKSLGYFQTSEERMLYLKEVQFYSCFYNPFCLQLVYSSCMAAELAARFLFQAPISNCLQTQDRAIFVI